VIQDYFLRVDELGTEAAAVTTVEVVETTGMPPAPYVDMFCNRPFAFAIRENATGLILFMGEYDFVPQEEGN
jgi:serpin B